jgi:CDP-diacylglycerol--glycerol-3-phosphate 3-phosphatidyltransferase
MSENKIFNASNSLSFFRLLLVIPAWIAFNNFDHYLARYSVAAIGIAATITDILDGYLARKLNQITEFGKVIDPLADKVLIVFVVLNLFLIGEIPDYYFYMIVARCIDLSVDYLLQRNSVLHLIAPKYCIAIYFSYLILLM